MINLPANAVMSVQRSFLASTSVERVPVLTVTQGITRPLHLALPTIMNPCMVWVVDPTGGEVPAAVPNGIFSLPPQVLQTLYYAGIRSVDLRFVSPNGLWVVTRLTFNLSTRSVTVTVL